MGVAVDAQGAVYVVDYGRNHIVRWDAAHGARVVFQSHGIANWLSAGGWGWRPTGVAIEKESLLVMEGWALPTFAAELIGNPRVSRLTANGKLVTLVAVSNPATRILTAALFFVLGAVSITWLRKRMRR